MAVSASKTNATERSATGNIDRERDPYGKKYRPVDKFLDDKARVPGAFGLEECADVLGEDDP